MDSELGQETVGRSLAQACRLWRARAQTGFRQVGLHRGQQFVLGVLWRNEGLTQSELARRLHIRPATLTRALTRMGKAGLVERRPDEEDQRISRVYLTDAGRAKRESVEDAWRALEEEALEGFTPEERALLSRFLLRLRENLQREPAEGGQQ
jgi:DNA-binding MarR family transcriptional regulator